MRVRATVLLTVTLVCAGAAPAAPVMVEGVPRIGWSVNQQWQRISALYAALTALGCPATYEELLVRSGAAFGTVWVPGSYSYATIVVAPEDLVVNGAEAVGATAENRCFPSTDEAFAALRESLDSGRPLVAWGGVGASVICGYDADTQQLHVQSNGNKSAAPEAQPLATALNTPEYLGCPNSLVFLTYDPKEPLPDRDWGAILQRAVRFAEWPESKPLGPGALYGLAAYEAWADTLRMGPDDQGAPADVNLHIPVTTMIAAARTAAANILSADATLHEGFAEAAQHYQAEVAILKQMNAVLAGGGQGQDWNAMLKAMADNLTQGTGGEAAAQLIDQARVEDEQAIECLRRAMQDLGFEERPRPPATPPRAAGAEEHYQRGLGLKRAGNLAEAATELRAAIAADPKHARAHYALAWVLKDLQDEDGAAAEFRKVIEVGPDSPEAADAKKALDRMGR